MQNAWELLEEQVSFKLPNGRVTTESGNVYDIKDIIDHPGYGCESANPSSKATFVSNVSSNTFAEAHQPNVENNLQETANPGGRVFYKAECLFADTKGIKLLSMQEHCLLFWDWKVNQMQFQSILVFDRSKMFHCPEIFSLTNPLYRSISQNFKSTPKEQELTIVE